MKTVSIKLSISDEDKPISVGWLWRPESVACYTFQDSFTMRLV